MPLRFLNRQNFFFETLVLSWMQLIYLSYATILRLMFSAVQT